VTVASAWPSPYTYDLLFNQPGSGLTNGMTFNVQDDSLARVAAHYRSTAPGQYYSVFLTTPVGPEIGWIQASAEDIPARTVRTEMFTAGAAFAQARVPEVANYGPLWEEFDQPQAAGEHAMNVGSGPWVPTPLQDQTDIGMVFSQGAFLSTGVGMGDSAGNLKYLEGVSGNVTSITCQPPACQQTPNGDKLSGDGTYQIVNDQSQTANPLSVRSHTEWTVNVHLSTRTSPAAQPAIQATWFVDGGPDNIVPADRPYQVGVVPSYPAGAGSHGVVTARLWATYDDGKTWTQVPGTQTVRPGQPATFTLRTPAQTNGFAGYRVQMSDADGNAINQMVIRAAITQPPPAKP
jgi:hypothetical protein